MATLEELMAEVGLAPSKGQEKTASQKPSSKEVNEVLENLGLSGGVEAIEESGVIKQAAEEKKMGLTDIYEELFAGEAQAQVEQEQGQEKVAADESQESDESTTFGELVGYNFAVAREAFEKVAFDVGAEAGHDPMHGMGHSGQLTSVIGKEKSPRVAVNAAPSEEPLKVSGSSSPFAGGKGKMLPIVQAYLKRVGGKEALIGAQKD